MGGCREEDLLAPANWISAGGVGYCCREPSSWDDPLEVWLPSHVLLHTICCWLSYSHKLLLPLWELPLVWSWPWLLHLSLVVVVTCDVSCIPAWKHCTCLRITSSLQLASWLRLRRIPHCRQVFISHQIISSECMIECWWLVSPLSENENCTKVMYSICNLNEIDSDLGWIMEACFMGTCSMMP